MSLRVRRVAPNGAVKFCNLLQSVEEEEDVDQRRRPVFGADSVFEDDEDEEDRPPWNYAHELGLVEDEDDEYEKEEEESDTEGRLDFGSITSTVNDKISSVGTSVTSGVDVSGTHAMGGSLTRRSM